MGFQLPQGVINLDQAFYVVTPLVSEQTYHLQEFLALPISGFQQHSKNIWLAGQGCHASAWTFGIVYADKRYNSSQNLSQVYSLLHILFTLAYFITEADKTETCKGTADDVCLSRRRLV